MSCLAGLMHAEFSPQNSLNTYCAAFLTLARCPKHFHGTCCVAFLTLARCSKHVHDTCCAAFCTKLPQYLHDSCCAACCTKLPQYLHGTCCAAFCTKLPQYLHGTCCAAFLTLTRCPGLHARGWQRARAASLTGGAASKCQQQGQWKAPMGAHSLGTPARSLTSWCTTSPGRPHMLMVDDPVVWACGRVHMGLMVDSMVQHVAECAACGPHG